MACCNLFLWTTVVTLAVGVLSQDCTFDNTDNPLCSWVPDLSNSDYIWKLGEGPTPQKKTGPPADHSGVGKYIYAQSSTDGNRGQVEIPRRSRTRFTSPTIRTNWMPKVMRFYFYMYGKHIGILNVFVIVRGGTNKQPSYRQTRNGGQEWKVGELRIPANSTVKIVFEAVSGKGVMGDIAIDDITFYDSPVDCTFESDIPEPECRFTQDANDNFDWQINSGKTPTRRTGPTRDHTYNNAKGSYMYIEASGPDTNDKAYFVSPIYSKDAGQCELNFWYHMNGDHIGHLKVHIMRRPGFYGSPDWKIFGDQGESWHEGVVNITDVVGNYQVVFEGIRGTGHEGDISLDDIKLLGIDCMTEAAFQELANNETNRDYCVNDPCVNGGVCVSGNGQYNCNCLEGWTGDNCQIEAVIDSCAGNPCLNGAHCINLAATTSYRCDCSKGWSGRNCSVEVTVADLCDSNPCLNGGTCTSFPDRYECNCTVEWSGDNCEVDLCESNPCLNDGTCTSFSDRYECQCTVDWSGDNCEVDERDKCESMPCMNGATCSSFVDRYECACPEEYSGINCELDVDECEAKTPCQNGGTCLNLEGSYNCTCPQGWHGRNCNTECANTNDNCDFWAGVGECSSNPRYMLIYCQKSCGVCQDYVCEDTHANCVQWESIGECKANPFFMLANCHKSCKVCIDDECVSNPCQNGATCTDGDNSYNCTCAPGFRGENCEINIDECASQPCQNGGTCVDDAYSYSCNCTDMYQGTLCEQRITACSSNPCVNGGTCNDVGIGNSFICTCPTGFVGNRCETDVNECASNPCLNGGTCEDQINGFLCHCVKEWTGPRCALDFNECDSNPCQNGATCFHGVGLDLFVCTCAEGWQGNLCQMEVNECESAPCQNQGICIDKFAGYTCTCPPGWYGVNCEIEIQECASDPCVNGDCIEYINEYTCICYPGYNGINCELAIDECASNPCQNGATCEDQHNGHICICAQGFTGRYCEQVITTPKATTKAATTKPPTTRIRTTKPPTTPLKTKPPPTQPAAHQRPLTTEDWVPDEFEESSLSDSEYSGDPVDPNLVDQETDTPGGEGDSNVVAETSTSKQQTSIGRNNNIVSTIVNDINTRAKPSDRNEVTIVETLPVSRRTGKTQETVSTQSLNASQDNLHAPAQVAPIGHIIAIVVGAVFVITILAFLIILVVRQKKKARIGRYEHFSMDFKQDPVEWKDLDNRSDDTDPDLAVAKM
ncbi:uncharacterized protein [Amphiura filiformis]|uniref:uncharacterized protein isoform X12 n=1 Tax=Amphiura filiformis TaxID=82378 RepID=UPI003B2135A1